MADCARIVAESSGHLFQESSSSPNEGHNNNNSNDYCNENGDNHGDDDEVNPFEEERLRHYSNRWPTTQLSDRVNLLLQLSDTVKYLHKHRILHRDLKPDNLGVTFFGNHHHHPNDGSNQSNTSGSKPKNLPPTTLCLKIFDFDIARMVPKEVKELSLLSPLSPSSKKNNTNSTTKLPAATSLRSTRSFDNASTSARDSKGERSPRRSLSPSRLASPVASGASGENSNHKSKTGGGSSANNNNSSSKPVRRRIKGSGHHRGRPHPEQPPPDEEALFQMTARMGSPRYMAPEIARGEAYNLRSEVYTVCLLVHEVLTLRKPYDELPPEDHGRLVHFERPGYRPPLPGHWNWPADLNEVLSRGWGDISARPSMREVHGVLRRSLPSLLDHRAVSPPPAPRAPVQHNNTPHTPTREPKRGVAGLFHRRRSSGSGNHHHSSSVATKPPKKNAQPLSPSPSSSSSASDSSMRNNDHIVTVE